MDRKVCSGLNVSPQILVLETEFLVQPCWNAGLGEALGHED